MNMDGSEGLGPATLASPTDRFDLLLDAAQRCFRQAWVPAKPVTRMHITASQLRQPGYFQLGLFDRPDHQARAVARAKREVNEALGRFALRSGATLPLADVYRDEAQQYDVCDIHGKMCF